MENVSSVQSSEYTLLRGKLIKDYSYLSLGEAIDKFVFRRQESCSPSTLARYDEYKRTYFSDILNIPLSEIDNDFVQKKINLLSETLAPKTVKNAYNHLHSVLDEFLPDHFWLIHLPQLIEPDYYIPNSDDVKQLISQSNDKLLVPVLLAAYGGLRRSEICGLSKSDFTKEGVHVRRAVVYDKNRKPCVKGPKTKSGARFVPLPSSVLYSSLNWKYFGILPNALSKVYTRTVKKVDAPHFSFHKLRHYFASELHAQGVPDQYICKVGGWKPETLQKIYQHVLNNREKEINQTITSVFSTIIKEEWAS